MCPSNTQTHAPGGTSELGSEDGGPEFDRGSHASTTATTASLSSRIASLAVCFEEDRREPYGPTVAEEPSDYYDSEGDASEEEEEEEEVEITEEEVMRLLDQQEPPFQVCSRLFFKQLPSLRLRQLTRQQLQQFRSTGFVIVDNFITQEASARIHSDALLLHRQGAFQEASALGVNDSNSKSYTDRRARGDSLTWLHVGRPPATNPTFVSLLMTLQELQGDLQQVMALRHRSAEYQLSYYPPNGAQYIKHRDAFPDSGAEEHQRRVTAIVYANPSWTASDGGKLRIWPPKTEPVGQAASPSASLSSFSPAASTCASPCASTAVHHGYHPQPGSGRGAPSSDSGSIWEQGSDTTSVRSEASCAATLRSEHGSQPGGSACGEAPAATSSLTELRRHPEDGGPTNGLRTSTDDPAAVEYAEYGGQAVIDISPVAGRLVLFLSGAVDHAVLPNFSARVAVTAWCQ
ncbi:hypothetical protein WJX72_007516 [[Myrmecia] bisecta]|uniref:Fe2OG dioxygenase domain-containing protein n=1 Tax=[Myrmecia] bisecta TaxID=41462 RepID=A0AAW1QFI4_9CHLO